MLIADISVNRIDYIDIIGILRVKGSPPGNCKYIIKKPDGYGDKIFVHKYSDGYFSLLCKCLNYLKRQGYDPK